MSTDTVLIIGFTRRTSFHAAKFLLRKGKRVVICDQKKDGEKENLFKELEVLGAVVDRLGAQDSSILDEFQFSIILPSPGVPLTIPIIAEGKKRGIPVIGDIELFYQNFPKIHYIGITGTDGKTTTTTLLHEIIRRERYALIGGNVGIPIFEHAESVKDETVMVLELSSFQLEAVRDFRPETAAVLNIAEDHLDRYDSVQSYLQAKKRIFQNQRKEDFAVLNLDSLFFEKLNEGLKSTVLTFSRKSVESDIHFRDSNIFYKGKKYLDREAVLLRGIHNVENAMAAILMAKTLGIADQTIQETLRRFQGLPHRLERVRELDGVEYYNDSKSTTVNSLEKALESFEKDVILIAGGRDKGLDFSLIRGLAQNKVKKLVLIGEAAEKIRSELGVENTYNANSMEDAVLHARSIAGDGDVVLLSPGCASFDMFKNYEERGDTFRTIVDGLK